VWDSLRTALSGASGWRPGGGSDVSDDHDISAIAEKHNGTTKYRGRCSCGANSYMTYATMAMARAALRRTHMLSVDVNRSDDSTQTKGT
jgi:hypothetical protein